MTSRTVFVLGGQHKLKLAVLTSSQSSWMLMRLHAVLQQASVSLSWTAVPNAVDYTVKLYLDTAPTAGTAVRTSHT